MNSNHDFSDAKVGDLVTSLRYGYGVIIKVSKSLTYPIIVQFIKDYNTDIESCNYSGLEYEKDFAPTLFKGHIDINSLSINYNTI